MGCGMGTNILMMKMMAEKVCSMNNIIHREVVGGEENVIEFEVEEKRKHCSDSSSSLRMLWVIMLVQ